MAPVLMLVVLVGAVLSMGFLANALQARFARVRDDQLQQLTDLANLAVYIIPGVVIALAVFVLGQTVWFFSLLIGVPIACWMWYGMVTRWREGLGGSLAMYRKAAAAPKLSANPADLLDRIRQRLPRASLSYDDIVYALYEQTGGSEPPEPPEAIADIHSHIRYRAELETWILRSSSNARLLDDLFVDAAVEALHPIASACPPASGQSFFSTSVANLTNIGGIAAHLYQTFNSPRVHGSGLFPVLLRQLQRNAEEMEAINGKPGVTVEVLARTLLKDTKLAEILDLRLPYEVREELWYESAHIVAGSGGFKTQLLGSFIAHQLTMPRRPGFMVIDSQGAFLKELRDKLQGTAVPVLYVDLEEQDVQLNLFDRKFGEDFNSRGRAILSLASTFTYLFATEDAVLSTRMNAVFSRVLTLLMFAVPKVDGEPATFGTLASFMMADKPQELFRKYIETLPTDEQQWYSKSNLDSYRDTRQQIAYRIDALLEDPFIKRMLSAKRTNFDLDQLLHGGMVLVNTKRETHLKNSAFLGKLFIGLAEQVMRSREPTPQGDPHPAFLIIDEAQEYFRGESLLEDFIVQGRKRRFGLVLAHHYFAQAPAGLQTALKACAIHLASKVNNDDLFLLRSLLNTSEEVLRAQRPEQVPRRKHSNWADYALFTPDLNSAISVRIDYGNLAKLDPAAIRSATYRSQSSSQSSQQSGSAHAGSSSSQSSSSSAPPPPPPPPPPPKDDGQYDVEFVQTVSPAKMRAGGEQEVRVPGVGKVKIRIPPGSRYGDRIRIPGMGARKPDGTSGDIVVKLKQHPDTVDPTDTAEPKSKTGDDDMDMGAQPRP